jgi:hypothetical protein
MLHSGVVAVVRDVNSITPWKQIDVSGLFLFFFSFIFGQCLLVESKSFFEGP